MEIVWMKNNKKRGIKAIIIFIKDQKALLWMRNLFNKMNNIKVKINQWMKKQEIH